VKLPTWIFLVPLAGLVLLDRVHTLGLLLDPWLSRRQKRKLRELPARSPLDDEGFISRLRSGVPDELVVARVRQRVAEAVECLARHTLSARSIYPEDRIVADLGIGAADCLEGTAILIALEGDLGISIPDEEAETVQTVEGLIRLCERHRGERARK
jgi:acyl carrier protein